MSLNRFTKPDPEEGEIITEELVVSDDALVKLFALGPGAELKPHPHDSSSNVFHIVKGTVTVLQDDDEERVKAPGVVFHDRGVLHGARNDTEDVVYFTATLAPFPS
ncbi:cupin domain-containing protein [Haladaptatus sp. DJG-WS-42]|uniref:cupin domain-containing protein n=1 Tax=Haladaptatus sp. DJG-WS-42 TaxID=3120516 RepID=UPI0030CF50F9